MRAICAPVLLGGALATGTVMSSADSEAQDPAKEERKEEDPLLVKLRQEIASLIADLDSDSYRVRDQAQRRLEQIAVGWVEEKRKAFPMITLLEPKDGYSLEQQRRLGRILVAHEHRELQLLWRSTMFREPPEWKWRKDFPTAREVLAALEKQTGQKISLDNRRGIAESRVKEKLDGRTFWEVLEHAGKECEVYSERDSSLSLSTDERCVHAVSGSVLGQAHMLQYYHCDQTREINVQFFLEPSLLLGGAFIIKADAVTDKKRKIECDVDERGSVTLPYEEDEQSSDLTVTACLCGYETRVETVRDFTKVATFQVRAHELQILWKNKLASHPYRWSVHAQLRGGESKEERLHLMDVVKCRAFDGKGALMPILWFSYSGTEWQWEFHSEPYSIELTLPGRMTTAEKTLTFKGIPLN